MSAPAVDGRPRADAVFGSFQPNKANSPARIPSPNARQDVVKQQPSAPSANLIIRGLNDKESSLVKKVLNEIHATLSTAISDKPKSGKRMKLFITASQGSVIINTRMVYLNFVDISKRANPEALLSEREKEILKNEQDASTLKIVIKAVVQDLEASSTNNVKSLKLVLANIDNLKLQDIEQSRVIRTIAIDAIQGKI